MAASFLRLGAGMVPALKVGESGKWASTLSGRLRLRFALRSQDWQRVLEDCRDPASRRYWSCLQC